MGHSEGMAGAGQPWYMPAIWPIGNITATLLKPPGDKPVQPKAKPFIIFDPFDMVLACVAGLRNFCLAYVVIFMLHDDANPYPAFGAARVFDLSWVMPIVVRNTLATLAICGFWDWFLYFSPLQAKLHKYKITQQYPSIHQMRHDAAVTLFASFTGSLVEIALCHLWASGKVSFDNDFTGNFWQTFALGMSVTFWRIPHFHALHRGMHPWRTTTIPDVGKWLYRKVHSLHHKSYNPTAFSGTNMHPVESTLYYSAAFIPCLWGGHPILALTCLYDCAIGAWLGHDGFQWPGSGDYFHMLHHKHFDCNYGAPHSPLDWLFGTFAGSKEEVKRIWGKKESGEEANDTAVHPASAMKYAVS